MPQIQTIRQMYDEGNTKSEISRSLGISRPTVDKYLDKDDFSVDVSDMAREPAASKLDPYKHIIREEIEKQARWPRKQRYTATRMHSYLVDDLGFGELAHSYHLIRRYMNSVKADLALDGGNAKGTMPLCWHPGECQGDFGEASYYGAEGELVEHGKYFMLSFAYSNVHPAIMMPGENCECVCQALQDIFMAVGKVPNVIVFDNATGIGRRIGGMLRENELFTRFRLHYGFAARYCNPRSGNEKGNVENAVGTVRRNVFVPPLSLDCPMKEYNGHLVERTLHMDDERIHYRKGKPIAELFCEDLAAMHELPARPFNVARIARYTLTRTGDLVLDGGTHVYGIGPSHSRENVIVETTAWDVNVYTSSGKGPFVTFARLYGQQHEQVYDMNDLVVRVSYKPNSWPNSIVREQMQEGAFRSYLDSCSTSERHEALLVFKDLVETFGFGDALVIQDILVPQGKATRKEDAMMLGYRMASQDFGLVSNATGVDLRAFDELLPKGGLLCH